MNCLLGRGRLGLGNWLKDLLAGVGGVNGNRVGLCFVSAAGIGYVVCSIL